MSSLVVVSFPVEASRALVVCEAAETHPHASRHLFDEQLGRVSLVLDLGHLHAYADRCCERERVERWLRWCHDNRIALAWPAWCERNGLEP